MKKLLLIISLLLSLISCEEQEVIREMAGPGPPVWNPLYYALNEEKPYSGNVTSFYPNGQLDSEMTVVNGQPDGLVQKWYESGQLEGALTFVDGKPEGLNRWWYENGQLRLESTFVNGEGNGVSRQWHEDGSVKSEDCFKGSEYTDMSNCNE